RKERAVGRRCRTGIEGAPRPIERRTHRASPNLEIQRSGETMSLTISRREALTYAGMLGALAVAGGPVRAEAKFFRIGTGCTGGTYYPIGGLIANAISTATLNASAVATNGSVANVNGIVGGSMESGFSQADINYWAYTGTGLYEGKPKVE